MGTKAEASARSCEDGGSKAEASARSCEGVHGGVFGAGGSGGGPGGGPTSGPVCGGWSQRTTIKRSKCCVSHSLRISCVSPPTPFTLTSLSPGINTFSAAPLLLHWRFQASAAPPGATPTMQRQPSFPGESSNPKWLPSAFRSMMLNMKPPADGGALGGAVAGTICGGLGRPSKPVGVDNGALIGVRKPASQTASEEWPAAASPSMPSALARDSGAAVDGADGAAGACGVVGKGNAGTSGSLRLLPMSGASK
mmetsp:Transcript_108189/g.187891  ORF Transcript_108189/g.187891 Transcript_108189/m.187891 type:complete len:252 (+) Transcript_108189:161-916(+)